MTARLRAHRVLREIGLAGVTDGEPARRAPSLANEVWLLGDQVLRINPIPVEGRLHHEAVLAARLPAGVGYPAVIDHGVSPAGEWILLERVPGEPLSRVWHSLDDGLRRAAVHELGRRLRLIHETPLAPDDMRGDSPHVIEPPRLLRLLLRARSLPHVDPAVIDGAIAMVERVSPHLDPESAWVLAHGDLHFENLLWHEGHLSAVLDLEFARPAPRDLDLATLLRFCADPELHVADDYAAEVKTKDYQLVPGWLREVYPELFGAPHLRERLGFYLLAFDVWQLVESPPDTDRRELPGHHPYHRIRRAVEGRDQLGTLVL